jgi:hypothetical protein
MIKKLVFLAIIAGLVYLNHTNPKQTTHRAVLLEELQKSGPVPVEMQEKVFGNVDFSNFLVCSTMKTIDESKLISLGYMKKVKLVNRKWADEVRTKNLAYSSY